ncbi:MAG: ATP-binding cassette domain-containing protein [Proteobacteria bacterium]|nr:ATP-binding cassette domain-containing protein [Pseudomonadota bacterium]
MRETSSILPLQVCGLSCEIDGARLLENVSLDVATGGLTALIGPNGAGKSLFLRLCHGLLAPTSGTVAWQLDGGRRSGKKRHAMVFQHPMMLRRSVVDNLIHALATAGETRGEARRQAVAALERFGLAPLAKRPARNLSGGEKQRLAIARAAVLHPDVIFLDEPTSQLDPGATRQIERMLTELIAEGTTLVMATHDLGQARRLARRILYFSRGRLIEDAPAERFFTNPASPEARAFLAGELVW